MATGQVSAGASAAPDRRFWMHRKTGRPARGSAQNIHSGYAERKEFRHSAGSGLNAHRLTAGDWQGPVDDLDGLRDTGQLQSALQGDFKVSRRRTSRQRQDRAELRCCPATAHDGDCQLSRQGSQRTSQLLCERRKLAGLAPANGHDQLGMVLVERLSHRVIPLGARGGQGTF